MEIYVISRYLWQERVQGGNTMGREVKYLLMTNGPPYGWQIRGDSQGYDSIDELKRKNKDTFDGMHFHGIEIKSHWKILKTEVIAKKDDKVCICGFRTAHSLIVHQSTCGKYLVEKKKSE